MPSSPLRRLTIGVLLCAGLVLAGCDSAEKRAEEHYQSALELMAAGDVSRAAVEFRNVFNLNGQHREARMAYATMMAGNGNPTEAYRHFLLVAEQFPDDTESRFELTKLALLAKDWEEARRHGEKVIALAADDPRSATITHLLAYEAAVEAEDDSARREAATRLAQAGDVLGEGRLASEINIDNLLRENDFSGVLAEVDTVLAAEPDNERYHQLKLQLLGQLRDDDGIQKQLLEMVGRFPENPSYPQSLIQWYVAQGNAQAAEDFIRSQIAAKADADADVQRALLLRFIQQTRGPEAAVEQADAFLTEAFDPLLFRSLRAGLLFDTGDREGAISAMQGVADEAADTEIGLNAKVALARMQTQVGNEVAARQLVEEVLADDPANVDANKQRAAWLIEDDMPDDAILALRRALDRAPNDADVMTLMAQAHLRNGSRGLAGEMLALAVEASGSAPDKALEYSRFLLAEDNGTSAEQVLLDSLRVAPNNTGVLLALGRIYIAREDWARAEQVEGTLRRAEEEASANALEVERLRGQGRTDEAIALLEELADEAGGAGPADVSIVRQRISAGEYDAARAYLEEKLATQPEDQLLRLLRAVVHQSQDEFDEAEAIYRDILSENSQAESVWRTLYTMKLRQGQREEARAVLDEAIAAIPEGANLLWALAVELERDGDIDGAIALYSQLYERLPNSPIVANNLASLLATYKDDGASLEQAYRISRRLRGVEVPAFQDTYGWIAHRRGETDEALEHLEPAAAALAGDPIVQYHLGAAYASAGRTEEAIAQFRKALDIAGPADTRPQIELAKAEIARLEAEEPGADPQ